MAGGSLAERDDAHQHGAAHHKRPAAVVSHSLIEPAGAPDLTPQRERLPELDADLSPRHRAPARLQHHAQDAVDAESRVPEAGVGVVHFAFSPQTVASICSPDLHKNLSPR